MQDCSAPTPCLAPVGEGEGAPHGTRIATRAEAHGNSVGLKPVLGSVVKAVFYKIAQHRRMEVYTAAYDFGLAELLAPQAMILDEGSYADLKASGRPIL